MKKVKSTNLKSVEYVPSQKVLLVRFQSGALYSFSGVPQKLYDGLLAADSKGDFFNEEIRDKFRTLELSK